MAKYKLTEGNFDKLLYFFGLKDRPKKIGDIIDNDPVLKQIDKKMADLNKDAADRLKRDPKMVKLFKAAGVSID